MDATLSPLHTFDYKASDNYASSLQCPLVQNRSKAIPQKKKIHRAQEPYTILQQHNPVNVPQLQSKFLFQKIRSFIPQMFCQALIYHNKSNIYQRHTVQKIVVGVSLNATLANPKSQIFNLQFALANIFFGFKSRWQTFAAKNYITSDMYHLPPQKQWGKWEDRRKKRATQNDNNTDYPS